MNSIQQVMDNKQFLKEAFRLMAERSIINEESLSDLNQLIEDAEVIDLEGIEELILLQLSMIGLILTEGVITNKTAFLEMIKNVDLPPDHQLEIGS